MLVVRNCFLAKPGKASELAGMFKELGAAVQIPNHRVLTDMTGEFNRVVFEYPAENFAALDAMMQEYATNPVFKEKMKGYSDLWVTGHREVMKIW